MPLQRGRMSSPCIAGARAHSRCRQESPQGSVRPARAPATRGCAGARARGAPGAASRNPRRASSGRHGPQRLAIVRERGRARPAAARRALHQVVLDELRAQQQRARVAQVVLGCARAAGCHAPQPEAQRGSKSHRTMCYVGASHGQARHNCSQGAHEMSSQVLVRTNAQCVGEDGGTYRHMRRRCSQAPHGKEQSRAGAH